ncbi:hypothetical protein WN943_004421 [Citrus x changshan-huyou]
MVSKHWLQEPKEFNYMIALTWKVLRGKNFNSTQFLQNKSLRMYNQMSPNKKKLSLHRGVGCEITYRCNVARQERKPSLSAVLLARSSGDSRSNIAC